jgi:hypothetical protein
MTGPAESAWPLRTISIEIPDDWTPATALAVFCLLDDLHRTIDALYGQQIREEAARRRSAARRPKRRGAP